MVWQGLTSRTLNSAWKKLRPERYFEVLESETPIIEEILLGKSMGLKVDDGGINNLVEEHSGELTTDKLLQLQEQ